MKSGRAASPRELARGNCTINLWARRETGRAEIRLNETALRQAEAVAERARDLTGLKHARLDTLLGMRGVVETAEAEESEEALAALHLAMIASLAGTLDERARGAARASGCKR